MQSTTTKWKYKIKLSNQEKSSLKKRKFRMADLQSMSIEEIKFVLEVNAQRAKEIHALIEFQKVPSVGIKFAEDLVFLGLYSIDELKSKEGAKLLNEYEIKKGFRTDPCVEDQFWLVVHYANYRDTSKNWWSFSQERKEYRSRNGYPKDRPDISWFELREA